MLEQISIKGFKSLKNLENLRLPRLAVLFGPNAAGKSNFLDALMLLSRTAKSPTLFEAFQEPIRGYPVEQFSFPSGGLTELLKGQSCRFDIEARIVVPDLAPSESYKGRLDELDFNIFQYRLGIEMDIQSGGLKVFDENLAWLNCPEVPNPYTFIESRDGFIFLRVFDYAKLQYNDEKFPLGVIHTLVSQIPKFDEYDPEEQFQNSLSDWRIYYLDPRVLMRQARPPATVTDIGVNGEYLAPFLNHLRVEAPEVFESFQRTVKALIPSVERIELDLDSRRGTLDIFVRQNGIEYPSRVISEGTLRVMGLCAMVVNPWSASLIAFEEPENGVHPRRLELIAELLANFALERKKQLIVTTHSPLFCSLMLAKARQHPDEIGLFATRQTENGSEIRPFTVSEEVLGDPEIMSALSDRGEEGVFESLMMRGMIDE
jgi:predicted ATPase